VIYQAGSTLISGLDAIKIVLCRRCLPMCCQPVVRHRSSSFIKGNELEGFAAAHWFAVSGPVS